MGEMLNSKIIKVVCRRYDDISLKIARKSIEITVKTVMIFSIYCHVFNVFL
jgi:hypothetical protein